MSKFLYYELILYQKYNFVLSNLFFQHFYILLNYVIISALKLEFDHPKDLLDINAFNRWQTMLAYSTSQLNIFQTEFRHFFI